MTEQAYNVLERAWAERAFRNDARRIRYLVDQARGKRDAAGRRWPFELLQNAHDAGPRAGRDGISVQIAWVDQELTFNHDGKPFTADELTALLSGGSSKDYESTETTGRFGTGFLSTHVLASRLRISGILEQEENSEQFILDLDRAGDEELILENCVRAREQMRAATPVEDISDLPSATFTYYIEDGEPVDLGLAALGDSLAYIFLTCEHLSNVSVTTGNSKSVWSARNRHRETVSPDHSLNVVDIEVSVNGALRKIRTVGFSSGEDASVMLVSVLTPVGAGWRLEVPSVNAARVCRRFPIPMTRTFPIDVVIEAPVDVEQERANVLWDANNKTVLSRALESLPAFVQYAIGQGWEEGYRLARLERIGDDDAEDSWLNDEFAKTATALGALDLVKSEGRLLPALDLDRAYADFVLPRLSGQSSTDECEFNQAWSLFDRCDNVCPPEAAIAAAWTRIAKGWSDLGVAVRLMTLQDLADDVRKCVAEDDRKDVTEIEKLDVGDNPIGWIADFAAAVGSCWRARGGGDLHVLDGLLPDQHGRLRRADQLTRDAGVPAVMKEMAAKLGRDFRETLLDGSLVKQCSAQPPATEVLDVVVKETTTEPEVVQFCVNALRTAFPDGKTVTEADQARVAVGLDVLKYLWDTRGEKAAEIARQCPLVATDSSVMYWTIKKMMMAPPSLWPEEARAFVAAYPSGRVLHSVYDNVVSDGTSLAAMLHSWGMTFTAPLVSATVELKEKRLIALADNDPLAQNATVQTQTLSQIALLQPEVLEHCQEGVQEASALLGLVLRYVVLHDDSWRTRRQVIARSGGQEIHLSIREALWLADLQSKAWVPFETGEGPTKTYTKTMPTKAALETLLKPEWIRENQNGVQLLTECFGFDPLELQLLATARDDQTLVDLRQQLARLVEAVGNDPSRYTELIEHVNASNANVVDVNKWRVFGLAVQDAIKQCLESHGVFVEVVDHGYDFRLGPLLVTLDDDGMPTIQFGVGERLLEVKATTQDSVRMTPLQVATAVARNDSYSLCVVDLRGYDVERVENLAPAVVGPLARFVDDIGETASITYGFVDAAKQQGEVSIRNDAALRYAVNSSVWSAGKGLDLWVKGLLGDLAS